jgi:anti-sigma factor RsiW
MTASAIDWNAAMTMKRSSAQATAKACEQLAVDLSAYFDGELGDAERNAVEQHVSECDACTDKLENLKKLRNAMSNLAIPTSRRGSVLEMLKAELRGEGGMKSSGKRRMT